MPPALLTAAVAAIAAAATLAPRAAAYSWSFATMPAQCGTVTLSVTGGGSPPFRALVIPYGPTPLPNAEVRTVMDIPFNDSTSLSFRLRYPASSQFIITVSDSVGFGSGGTSSVGVVQDSNDATCFDPNTPSNAIFPLEFSPPYLTQCTPTRIYWDPSEVQGTPAYYAVIPGGDAFQIPFGITNKENDMGLGTGFNWTVPVKVGTTVVITGGDDRGLGLFGSASFSIRNGDTLDGSCLNANSPSSTPGSPAGGAYPTMTGSASGSITASQTSSQTGSQTGSSMRSSSSSANSDPASAGSGFSTGGIDSNIAAIVGGVIGGLAALLALALLLRFLRRRRRFRLYTAQHLNSVLY